MHCFVTSARLCMLVHQSSSTAVCSLRVRVRFEYSRASLLEDRLEQIAHTVQARGYDLHEVSQAQRHSQSLFLDKVFEHEDARESTQVVVAEDPAWPERHYSPPPPSLKCLVTISPCWWYVSSFFVKNIALLVLCAGGA